MKHFKKAFTLVEIMVASAASAAVITSVLLLFSYFFKSYGKSESVGLKLHDAVMLVSNLRKDLSNAVVRSKIFDQGTDIIYAEKNQLAFSYYDNSQSKILPVVYELENTERGGVLKRRAGNGKSKIMASDVAYLKWKVGWDHFETKPFPVKRLWIYIDILLSEKNSKEKSYRLKTYIFPARLNRQVN